MYERIKFLVYGLSLIAIVFLSCVKEEPYECPLIQTGDVTDISDSGAVFHGKIMGIGSKTILDYGFVWDKKSNPTIDNSYIKSFGTTNQLTIFDASITSAMTKGQTYFVRTYIKDEKSVIYGKEVSFISLGCNPPKITSFSPDSAAWGDTITIFGENFSCKKSENVVLFKYTRGYVVSSTQTEIKVIVPAELMSFESNISVIFWEYNIKSDKLFKLASPEIISFNPESGTYKTIVTIKGKGFHPNSTKVKFDTILGNITKSEFRSITVEFPPSVKDGEVNVSVSTPIGTDTSDQKFHNVIHSITGFSPASATFGDTITIQGDGFSANTAENTVKFGPYQATIIETSVNSIKAIVPNSLNLAKSKINITTKQQTTYSHNEFCLKPPEITTFTPVDGTFNDVITISGNCFSPVFSNNVVKFGDATATIIGGNTTQLLVKVPENYYSTNGKNKINVTVCGLNITSTADFNLNLHSISGFTPDYGSRGDVITINGQNFNPDSKYNTVYIGNALATINTASATTLTATVATGVIHGNQNISIEIAGRKVDASSQFMVYEPWRRVADFPGVPRSNAIGFMLEGQGYVLGGNANSTQYQDFWRYDPIQNSWTKLKDFPVRISGEIPVYTSSGIYIFKNKQIYRYNKTLDEWTQITTYPGESNYCYNAFAVNNKLYFGALINEYDDYNFKSELWEYDEQNDIWSSKGSMNFRYANSKICFSLNNKGYWLFANRYNHPTTLKEYDPITNTWNDKFDYNTIMQDIIFSNRYGAFGVLIDQFLYIGTGNGNKTAYTDIYRNDLITNSCTRLIDMPEHGRTHGTALAIGSKIFVGLGNLSNTIYKDFWEYDPSKAKP